MDDIDIERQVVRVSDDPALSDAVDPFRAQRIDTANRCKDPEYKRILLQRGERKKPDRIIRAEAYDEKSRSDGKQHTARTDQPMFHIWNYIRTENAVPEG